MTLIIADNESTGTTTQFIIRPTRSLSPRGMLIIFSLFCLTTLFVNIVFLVAGAWLVVPFGGAELLVLGTALWMVRCSSEQLQTIIIDGGLLRVQHIHSHKKHPCEWNFQRYWVKAILSRDRRHGYPSKLFLRSHGKSVEVGAFLTNTEREILAAELTKSIDQYGRA